LLWREKEFFECVDQNCSDALKEFSEKHLRVVDRKAPSIKKKIERCKEFLESCGYHFPLEAPKIIYSARNRLFHGGRQSDEDLRSAADLVRAFTTLVLLSDLGINAGHIGENIGMLSTLVKTSLDEQDSIFS
jgi:hypothetical protein